MTFLRVREFDRIAGKSASFGAKHGPAATRGSATGFFGVATGTWRLDRLSSARWLARNLYPSSRGGRGEDRISEFGGASPVGETR